MALSAALMLTACGEHEMMGELTTRMTPDDSMKSKTITWSSVRDTFHASLSIDVQPSSATSQAVTLSRVVGRLRISATDVVPANAAKLTITPSTWYYGLNYQTGEAVGSSTSPIVVNIPSSYVGTQNLVTSCYTVSGSSAWQTNITVSLIASDESSLGSVTIPNVPIQRNHITSYSGGIVGAGRSISVNASDDDWVDDGNVNW